MKCPKCGYEQAIYDDINEWWHCPQCHGSGEVQMTNEEYLRSLNTEQLAEWLNDKIIICAVCDQQKSCGYFINETFHLCPYHEGKNKSWEMWLKQPHSEVGK